MKRLVAQEVGSEIRVAKTYWHGETSEIRAGVGQISLPSSWVLKPNNLGGGLVFFGNDTTKTIEIADFISQCEAERKRFERTAPAGWRGSRGGYLIEEKIGADGPGLKDYKVHVFRGKAKIFSVYEGRFGRQTNLHYSLPLSPFFSVGERELWKSVEYYPFLDELVLLSERLSFNLDYVRVDFYVEDSVVWIGELTPFPIFDGLGKQKDADKKLSEYWFEEP